jgi:hypothetical protein
MQELIFSTVWSFHGRIDGLSDDFGRASYINSPDISEYYWTNTEQRFEIVFNLMESIRTADSQMIK